MTRWPCMIGITVAAEFVCLSAAAQAGDLPAHFRLKDDSCHLIGVALNVPNSQRIMVGELNVSTCTRKGRFVSCQMASQEGGQERSVDLKIDTNSPPLVFLAPKGGINFVYIDLDLGRYSWTQLQLDFDSRATFTKQCTGAISLVK